MKEIRIWEVEGQNLSDLKIEPIETVGQTETEKLLEEILIKKPELLMPDLRVVGRQTDTPGGPLDLLGVDGDGRLVIFELKRGTLTRDAVAQVIDYASYLDELDADELSVHISERSGKGGVEKIDNFKAWYQEQFAKSFNAKLKPRMILVGLGADDRTKRMVAFLAESDLDVSLVTFYGFKRGDAVFLARQVEVEAKPQSSSAGQKVTNLEKLQDRIQRLGVSELYPDLAKFFRERLSAYEWPNQSGYTYYLPEFTESGNESNRSYLSLYLSDSKPGIVQLYLHSRAVEAALRINAEFEEKLKKIMKILPSGHAEIWIKSQSHWESLIGFCDDLCPLIAEGWKMKWDEGSGKTLGAEVDSDTNAR